MARTLPLVHWQSRIEPEHVESSGYAGETDQWKAVRIPHNWQDYHGYRGISHGDLHGRALYRCEVPPGQVTLEAEGRIRIFFQGVAGRATVLVNDIEVGIHVGSMVGFTLDITEAWAPGSANRIEVCSALPSMDQTQPFSCGGCHGTPFSEGPQPLGIFRPVTLMTSGPVHLEAFGLHVWSPNLSEEIAQLNLRHELVNPGNTERFGFVRLRLLGTGGEELIQTNFPFTLRGGEGKRFDNRLPDLPQPRLWSPDDPFHYKIVGEVFSKDGLFWDRQIVPCGLRELKWPTILEPEADHDVRSPNKRGRLVDNGLSEPSPENNFFNESVKKGKQSTGGFEAGSVRITGIIRADRADLEISARIEPFDHSGNLQIHGEITNDLGTVFYHQFKAKAGSLPCSASLAQPRLWKSDSPYLYRLTLDLLEEESGDLRERIVVRFALLEDRPLLNAGKPVYDTSATRENPLAKIPDAEKVFRVNGKPVFLNGTCAYETLLGGDYAWKTEQVEAYCSMVVQTGFNAFRDGHHPRNLHTYELWDRDGILCWTQMGSHLYSDNEEFRDNFREAARAWVRERRNHPCVFAWGLQNESILPTAFARELCGIIREEDPTAGSQRLITTCNGGKGTDWNIPQEWSGTYGGNCGDLDLERAQLVGEYGSWRQLGIHRDKDYEGDENDFTESWAVHSLGAKISLGLKDKHRAMGFFQWPFATFPNPGRSIERIEGPGQHAISPVNCKGLFTAWLQPTDAYYLYQSSLSDPVANPMVYIVSHTWPRRWKSPGTRDRILVYSNCDEVELFNDIQSQSLGVRRNPGPGMPFRWDAVPVRFGLLYAEGRCNGRVVARDLIYLDGMPEAPGLASWISPQTPDPADLPAGCLRLNCGGPEYVDRKGHRWEADLAWSKDAKSGSLSWGHDFGLECPDLASLGEVSDPVRKTREQALYQTFRYGRHRLRFRFDIRAGCYRLHMGLFEPWYGIGSQGASFAGWRQFDVAVNGLTLLKNIDPWSRTGSLEAGVESIEFHHSGGIAEVHFPTVASGQALVSWLALEPILSK